MEEKNKVPEQMEQKTVKFEIGKLLAIVIAVVVVAGVAGVFLSSNYFKGSIGDAKTGALNTTEEVSLASDPFTLSLSDLQQRLTSPYLTKEEEVIIIESIQAQEEQAETGSR